MKYIIFENEQDENFYPFNLTKALWELKCGIFSFGERIEKFIINNFSGSKRSEIFFFTRDNLSAVVREKYGNWNINDFSVFDKADDLFFISGTSFPNGKLTDIKNNSIVMYDNIPLFARTDRTMNPAVSKNISELILNSEIEEINHTDFINKDEPLMINRIWDTVKYNKAQITLDFKLINIKKIKKRNKKSVTIIGDKDHLIIEKGVRIDPFVVIDLTEGPVYIKAGSEINSFTRIEGPCFIGNNTVVTGAKIRSGTSIGDSCRIGGEIEESIFHGFSNKYHDGFIGHSYIGEWVNLGAMTSNSDLKNNYSNVKVFMPNGVADTGSNKIGVFIGDFVKTGIGTLFNTGAVAGVGAMFVSGGTVSPYHVPSFSWFLNSEIVKKEWRNDFINTCKLTFPRRGKVFTKEYENFLLSLFNLSKIHF